MTHQVLGCCSPRRKTESDHACRTIYIDIRRYYEISDSSVHLVYHQDIISGSGYAAGVPYVQGILARLHAVPLRDTITYYSIVMHVLLE